MEIRQFASQPGKDAMVFNVGMEMAGTQGEQGRASKGWGSGCCQIIIINHNLLPLIIMASSVF